MRDDDAAWALLGLGALVALSRAGGVAFGEGWVWPVPPIRTHDGVLYQPVVSDGLGSPRPGGRIHRGVDIMFRRRSLADRPEYPAGTHDGSRRFFAPPSVRVHAARAGKIWSAGWTPTGFSVVVDHGAPWATYYTHMDALTVPEHRRGVNVATGKVTAVRAGDVLGTMGWSPRDGQQLRHLHFEVWRNGAGSDAAVDPQAAMAQWGALAEQSIPRASGIGS